MSETRAPRPTTLPIPRPAPFGAAVRVVGTSVACGAAVLLSVATWAWSDVLTWQRIFETRGMYEFDVAYQAGHEVVLWGLIVLGALLLARSGLAWSAAYACAVYSLAYGGLADWLYYWLDGRAVPTTLPWLDVGHPLLLVHPVTADGLVASVTMWTTLWSGVLLLGTAWRISHSGQASTSSG